MRENESTSRAVDRRHDTNDPSIQNLRRPYAHWHERPLRIHPLGDSVCGSCQKMNYSDEPIIIRNDDIPKFKEYNKLTNSIMEIIEDFGLVRFTAMSIEDFDSVNRVCQLCDKSIGYSPEFHKNLKTQQERGSSSSSSAHPAVGPASYFKSGVIPERDWDPRRAYSKMPAEPISASNLDITERFFNSVKISEDDDDGAEGGTGEGKEEIKKEAVEK